MLLQERGHDSQYIENSLDFYVAPYEYKCLNWTNMQFDIRTNMTIKYRSNMNI